ncbi:MAG: M1 family metallopeptidase [Bacteroidetes bacterium]|nr:M1 family metallopeptidase [Bacteroidota bacterium]
MKVKRNYILLIGITVLMLSIVAVIIFVKPVEVLNQKINRELRKNNYEVIPEKNIPADYYTNNQTKIDVQHYSMEIELFPSDKVIKGNIVISGIVTEPKPDRIDLNFYDNMNISKISINGINADYSHSKTTLSIELEEMESEKFEIAIEYEGSPRSLYFGSFNFKEYKNEPVVYTINEPIFASTWYPCNDLPNDKATYDITIINDSSFVSVSNGSLIDTRDEGSKRFYHWRTNYPTSSYLVAIYSAKYKLINDEYNWHGNSLDLQYYVFPDQVKPAAIDFEDHKKYLEFFSNTFGPYPFVNEKYGIAEILWTSGAIENQTITGLGTNFITGKKQYELLLVHELAHHWWGNAVGPDSWRDVWLNEGFATYCEGLYQENKNGAAYLKRFMKDKIRFFDESKLYNPGVNLFHHLIYDKGAWVLHMLRNKLGDKDFFDGLRNYYNEFKYKNASTFDFIKIMENSSGKNLSKFFEQWVTVGKGIIEIEYDYYQNGKNLLLNIAQVQTGYEDYQFPLDVKIEMGNNKYEQTFFISTNDTTINLPNIFGITNVSLNDNMSVLADFYEKPKENNE